MAGFQVDCVPSEDRKKVTLTIESEEAFGLREMIKVLAGFIKHQMEENKIEPNTVALKPGDKAEKLDLSNVVKCVMCQGSRASCDLCRGKGYLEAKFKKGLEINELRTTGKLGKSGFPVVIFPKDADTR